MVEIGWLPGTGVVARATIRAVLSVVIILLGVTGVAIGGSSLEHIIRMTGSTSHLGMCAGQFEGC
jgi:hypothetical protein